MDVRSIKAFTDCSCTIRYLARSTGYIRTAQCPRSLCYLIGFAVFYNNNIYRIFGNVYIYLFKRFLFVSSGLHQVRRTISNVRMEIRVARAILAWRYGRPVWKRPIYVFLLLRPSKHYFFSNVLVFQHYTSVFTIVYDFNFFGHTSYV